MSSPSTRQRLSEAALELFLSQGISSTTTRQIANLAGVNEVTLFRHFGNKHGVLLSVLQELPPFNNLEAALQSSLQATDSLPQGLRDYADKHLRLLEERPDLVRSLIGEGDQYPRENRQILSQRLSEATRCAAHYFAGVIQQAQLSPQLSPYEIASLLHTLLLGYAVIEFTTEPGALWGNRDDFVASLERLLLQGAMGVSPGEPSKVSASLPVMDLPAPVVQAILQAARKSDLQNYAIAYLLFAAGLTSQELIHLQRHHHLSGPQQQVLTVISPGGQRQVPVNQWIMGKRYGSYTNNPLTKWLKSRKDEASAMFLDAEGAPLNPAELQRRWQAFTQDITTPSGPPTMLQAHQTWCVEMLMRGMSLDNLSILTRQETEQLQSYAERAREKAALEQAAALDHKPQ